MCVPDQALLLCVCSGTGSVVVCVFRTRLYCCVCVPDQALLLCVCSGPGSIVVCVFRRQYELVKALLLYVCSEGNTNWHKVGPEARAHGEKTCRVTAGTETDDVAFLEQRGEVLSGVLRCGPSLPWMLYYYHRPRRQEVFPPPRRRRRRGEGVHIKKR